MAMDWGMMQNMVWQAFAKQRDSWPAEFKQAMTRFEVSLVKDPGEIRIICQNNEGVENDETVEKSKELLLNAILPNLSKLIAAFGCQTKVFK